MTIFIASLIAVLFVSIGIKVTSMKQHRKGGIWLILLSYSALCGMYWYYHTSWYWLIPIFILSLFFGLIWSSRGIRYLLFKSTPEKQITKAQKPIKQAMGKPEMVFTGDLKHCSTSMLIEELNKRGQIN